MRFRLVGLCGAVVLMGCESSAIRDAKRSAADATRDPKAAQFRNVRVGYERHICGEMNAKNGFGAYTGFEPFIVDSSGGLTLISAESVPVDQDLIAVSCIPAGPTRDSLVDLAFTAASDAMANLPVADYPEVARTKAERFKAWKNSPPRLR